MNVTFTKVQNDWLEASFYEMVQLPDVEVPAKPALFDADGKEVQAAEPAGTEPGAMQRVEVAFVSYHPTQLDLLRADAAKHGADLALHESMLEKWVAGHVPPAPPALTVADFDAALTEHLDAAARARQYDNRITCALRAGYAGPFQAEGQAFALWMDNCNAMAYQFLAEVQGGTRSLPASTQALIDALPKMVWPSK